jgi:hypothetical protein
MYSIKNVHVAIQLAQKVEGWTVVRFPDGAVTFVVIDHEILSTVICTIPLLLHVQK